MDCVQGNAKNQTRTDTAEREGALGSSSWAAVGTKHKING